MLPNFIEFVKKGSVSTSFIDSVERWYNSVPIDLNVVGSWVLILGFILTFCICFLSNKKSSHFLESISSNLLIISSVIWFLGVVIYIVGFYQEQLNWISVIPRAIIASFKMFVVTNELARVDGDLQKDAIYMSAFSLVHFMAAFITFLFIFKMIGYKMKSSLKLICHKWFYSRNRIVHLFWGVNEASILLAEDIRKNHLTETIIFIDIDDDCEDNTQKKATLSNITNSITIKNSEIARLDAIDALVDHCYNGPAALKGECEMDIFGSLQLRRVGAIVQKSKKSYFYFLSNDEAQNITGALNLQKDKGLRAMGCNKPIIYVHARRDANNDIFDHDSSYDRESGRMKIKIVDSAYLSILTLKQDESTLPVNCVKIDRATGLVDSHFNALIVGFGGTGQEAFKFLYEFSAFVNSKLSKSPFKCYAIDEQMDKIAGLVREKMPAIGEDELLLIQATIDSEKFWATVSDIIKDLNYVIIALNNDAIGLSLAVNLFNYAVKKRRTNQQAMKILVRCYDNSNEMRMTEVAENLNKSIGNNRVEIRLFGEQKTLYRCDTILSDATLRNAMEFNRMYEKTGLSAKEQWQKSFGGNEITRLMTQKKMSHYHAINDINRRILQNISNSQHCCTKMILMNFEDTKLSDRLELYYKYVNSRIYGTTKYECGTDDEQILLNLARVEHERWVASHKLMGYIYSPENDCVRMHHKCICQWENLDETTQSYDCNVVDTTIILAYNRLKEKKKA